jgi:hypothetical protein
MAHGNTKYSDEEIEKIGDELFNYVESNKGCITIAEFFIQVKKLHSNIPKRFSERSIYFENKLNDCKELIKIRLIKGGLGIGKKLNPHFTKFVLNANYNMVEQQFIKQETEITIKKDLATLFDEIDEIVEDDNIE